MTTDPSFGPPKPPPLKPSGGPPTKAKTLLERTKEKLKGQPQLLSILREYETRSQVRAALNVKHKDLTDYIEKIRTERLARYASRSADNRAQEELDGGEAGRIERLKDALGTLPGVDLGGMGDLVYRADGRSPWTIWTGGGFEYREGGSLDLVKSGLRSIALQEGNLVGWLATYRIQKRNLGMPTVSTGPLPEDSSGASNSKWQYAIVKHLTERPLTAATLGIPYKAHNPPIQGDQDRLWMDAPTLDAATEIAISGGPLGEITYLTPIPRTRIVGYMLLTDAPSYLLGRWKPFEKSALDSYRDVLLKYGEFNFKE